MGKQRYLPHYLHQYNEDDFYFNYNFYQSFKEQRYKTYTCKPSEVVN